MAMATRNRQPRFPRLRLRRKRGPRARRCKRRHEWPFSARAAIGGVSPFAKLRAGRVSMNLQRLIIAVLSLSTSLVAVSGAVPVQAQGGPVVFDDASGANGTCTASGPSGDRMIVCTDLRPGRGVTIIDPGAEPAPVAKDVAPAPASAPDAESAPETTDRAVASATDQDADNAPDELEPGLGLDPTNPDTDGDGVADGDEPNLYGTDPLNGDTDGDGVSDGEELFGIHTDPLVWDDVSAQGTGSTAGVP
jgi:hypothetical protein